MTVSAERLDELIARYERLQSGVDGFAPAEVQSTALDVRSALKELRERREAQPESLLFPAAPEPLLEAAKMRGKG